MSSEKSSIEKSHIDHKGCWFALSPLFTEGFSLFQRYCCIRVLFDYFSLFSNTEKQTANVLIVGILKLALNKNHEAWACSMGNSIQIKTGKLKYPN